MGNLIATQYSQWPEKHYHPHIGSEHLFLHIVISFMGKGKGLQHCPGNGVRNVEITLVC